MVRVAKIAKKYQNLIEYEHQKKQDPTESITMTMLTCKYIFPSVEIAIADFNPCFSLTCKYSMEQFYFNINGMEKKMKILKRHKISCSYNKKKKKKHNKKMHYKKWSSIC